MMEIMLLAQQKQDEYIKQLASKADVLTSHNKMLEAQIAQQATSSSTYPGKLPRKPESKPREQCNCVTLEGGSKDSKGIEIEEGGEANRAVSEENGGEFEFMTFREKNSGWFREALFGYFGRCCH